MPNIFKYPQYKNKEIDKKFQTQQSWLLFDPPINFDLTFPIPHDRTEQVKNDTFRTYS